MSYDDITHHPAADAFPMMDGARFRELVEDIRANGLHEPIMIADGMILDGRNRYKACVELGVTPTFEQYEGDPWLYVWSINGVRRDLVDEQRYLIWKHCAERSEEWQRRQQKRQAEANRKRSDAARGNQNAAKDRKNSTGTECSDTVSSEDTHPSHTEKASASKTNLGAVKRGDVLASKRPDLAEKVRLGLVKPAEAHRQMKRDEVSQKATGLPEGQYTVLYADPPWSYNDKRSRKDATGAEDHYPSMSLSELKALDVPSLAADDSVLFLWTTSPLLPDGLELMGSWGFRYKACFIWDKVKHNMGKYNSVRHEFLLIGTRGSGTPQVSKLFDSVQSIERDEHSAKPEAFREIIDTLYPAGRRIELFCRGVAADGWEAWGNEVESAA